MTHQDIKDRLEDYLDGELSTEETEEIKAHLEACAECTEEKVRLQSLLSSLSELPDSVAPASDLWSGIEKQIRPAGTLPVDFRTERSPWHMRIKLAAAAVVLMALSSGVTSFWIQSRDVYDRSGEPHFELASTDLSSFEITYSVTIDELTDLLQQRREKISPETARVIETNLAIIDEAIRTSREALSNDPGNQDLIRTVTAMYEEKVDLLQQVADLPGDS
jgi:hypothetical protein